METPVSNPDERLPSGLTGTTGRSSSSRRVTTDLDRDHVRAFFAKHLKDRTGWKVGSRQDDRLTGVPSILRVIEAPDANICAAVYASNNPEDVLRWRRSGHTHVADVIADEMLMIHELAVMPSMRRRGLATELMRSAIDDGVSGGATIATVLFDDNMPGLSAFYESLGLIVLPRGTRFALGFAQLKGVVVGFPQEVKSYRWAYRILQPQRVWLTPDPR